MQNEDVFNARLAKECRKLKPDVFPRKVAEKYQVGISDFYFVRGGRIAFAESKFVKSRPKGKHMLLSHVFTGPQQTFLKEAAAGGALSFGIIGLDYCKSIRVVPLSLIPKSGNWSADEYRDLITTTRCFPYWDVASMVTYMFGERVPYPTVEEPLEEMAEL